MSQPINATNAIGLQFVFGAYIFLLTIYIFAHCDVLAGNSGCGTDSNIYPVYLEYSIGDTSYLLTTLRYRGHLMEC